METVIKKKSIINNNKNRQAENRDISLMLYRVTELYTLIVL